MPGDESSKGFFIVECHNEECRRGIAIKEPFDDPSEAQLFQERLGVVCPYCGCCDDYGAHELVFMRRP